MPDAFVPYLAAAILLVGVLALRGIAAWARRLERRDDLMALADTVWTPARTGDTPGELIPGEDDQTLPDPVAEPVPCGHTWHTTVHQHDVIHTAGHRPVDCDGHHCALIGGHRIHRCLCGATTDRDQVVLVVDPPVGRRYVDPDSGMTMQELWGPPPGMVLYRGGAVHPACARGWLRDDVPPCTGCAAWLTDELKASTP